MKVLALAIARQEHMRIDGTQPQAPVALPAANVKSPAPATLFARLNTDVENEAVPPSLNMAVLFDFFDNKGFVISKF